MMLKIIYIIPAYNEASILREQMLRFLDIKPNVDITVFIVENGSSDNTYEVARLLESDYPEKFKAFSVVNSGIGYAYLKGIEEAIKTNDKSYWLCLSAADLPFGFSDLEQFIKLSELNYGCIIGSKLHEESFINRGIYRKVITLILSKFRKFLLGMKVNDCQGSIFIKLSILKSSILKIESRDFFYTTELISNIESSQCNIIEIPIVYSGESRKNSSVSISNGFNYLSKIIFFSIKKFISRNRSE